MTWPSGTRYVGDFLDGAMTGIGTVYYDNGTQKYGEWLDGDYVGPAPKPKARGALGTLPNTQKNKN